MSREKQIEEMALIICGFKDCTSCISRMGLRKCGAKAYAERFYNACYRKQSEDSIIIPPMSDDDIENFKKLLKKSPLQIIADDKPEEWISVDERLPEPNTHVLIYVFFHNQWQIVKGWHSYCDKKFNIVNSDYPSLTDIPVTHWMPLPEAPKMKGGE